MLGNFRYSNPTALYFGEGALKNLGKELAQYGPTVMLCYGGGSIKKNGIYEQVISALTAAGKTIVEDAGVMSNPTYEKLLDGRDLARKHNVDLILAVGGGSVIDYAKAVSVSVYENEDPWEKYYVRQENPTCKIIPVGSVLTMTGTGSEMNGGTVITNRAAHIKKGKVFGDNVMPRFSVLDPTFTYSVPQYQMVAGIFDIMSHILEQYLSGTDDNTSDYLSEGLMLSLVNSSRVAVKTPLDYEARSNIMWTATWALNTLIGRGKSQDWMVHQMGHAVSALTNATHGMTLAAVSLPYYHFILEAGLPKFVRFAQNVWHIDPTGKSDKEIALAGLEAFRAWMQEIGVVMNITELGVTPDMLAALADATFIAQSGYRVLTREEVIEVFRQSL